VFTKQQNCSLNGECDPMGGNTPPPHGSSPLNLSLAPALSPIAFARYGTLHVLPSQGTDDWSVHLAQYKYDLIDANFHLTCTSTET
jgi:hypothetical protein